MKRDYLESILRRQQEAHARLWEMDPRVILDIGDKFATTIREGGKILLFGNGGSAADAQHVAAELVGRFTRERQAWPAIALTTDTSTLTAIGNDYGFEQTFARQVQALARSGDLVVGISTSGGSPNVLRALQWARDHDIFTIGFTGRDGGLMPGVCDICFIAPVEETARIQELHMAVWHAVCDLVERSLTVD